MKGRSRWIWYLTFAVLAACGRSDAVKGDPKDAAIDSPVAGPDLPADTTSAATDAADARARPGQTPEDFWLRKVGFGSAQTARVCARGHRDPVATALCASPAPTIDGLAALNQALNLPPAIPSLFHLALANSSSGLSFRTVSALNPRVFAMSLAEHTLGSIHTEGLAVTAFSRGEQQVELFGHDPHANTSYLYLLTFQQDCNGQRCGPEHLLTPSIESDWRSWTLYEAEDLADTPLDCLSCHQPEGTGSRRRLLMRDLPQPWFHWFTGASEQGYCLDGSDPHRLFPDLRATFESVHPSGYGSFDRESLATASGHNLQAINFGFSPVQLQVDEPFVMPSNATVEEWGCHDRTTMWQEYRRRTLLEQGLPIPSYAFDNLDPVRAGPAIADFAGFVRQHTADDSFELMAGLLSDEHKRNVGVWPDRSLDATAILREMCVRCHDGRAPAASVRGRFDVRALTPASAARALERIDLPGDSPYLMPPPRAGELPTTERALVRGLLQDAARGAR